MGGAMGGCGRIIKLILIAINFVIFVAGGCALAVGAWIWSERSFPSSLMTNNMFIASLAVVVVMGAVLMLLSLLGCCGAAKEIKCILLTYYTLVFLVFVVMLIGGILQFVFREKVLTSLNREMYASIPNYGVIFSHTTAWDETQTIFQCCGVKSYKDWKYNVPFSCCKEIAGGQRMECTKSQNPGEIYSQGCLTKVMDLLRKDALYIGTIAIVITILLLVALLFSCALFAKIE